MSEFTVRYCHDIDPQLIVRRLIRNPNYPGKPTDVPGCVTIDLASRRKHKPLFFDALSKNVKVQGFRNPILVYNTKQGLSLSFGGSRLEVAQDLDKTIPAIIVDYTHDFFLCEEVYPYDWQKFFTDVPELFEFTDYGIDTHYSIERNRRHSYDPAGIAWTEELDDTQFLKEEFSWL